MNSTINDHSANVAATARLLALAAARASAVFRRCPAEGWLATGKHLGFFTPVRGKQAFGRRQTIG